jgi:hypothetical protein
VFGEDVGEEERRKRVEEGLDLTENKDRLERTILKYLCAFPNDF